MYQIQQEYGTIKIQNVKSLDASGNYLTLKIGELSFKLLTKYSNVTIGTISAKANSIAIAAGYTGLNIDLMLILLLILMYL
jgi:hypothetical protein